MKREFLMGFFTRQRLIFLLAAVMAITAHGVSYAQSGGMGNMANKAVEALANKVMDELKKKYTEVVEKEALSTTAKANIVNELIEMSRPLVMQFINSATAGRLPSWMELMNMVLKDILPHVPSLVAAAKEGGGSDPGPTSADRAVPYVQSLDEAILSAAIKISGELPAGASVAVINFSSSSENLNEYVQDELYGAILRNRGVVPVKPNTGQFQTIMDELNKTGELNSESGRSIGKLLGVQYLITGSIKQNGGLYDIVFNAVNLDVEIKSQYQASLNPRSDTQLASLLNIKPQPLSQPKSQPQSQSQSQSPTALVSQPKPVTIAKITGITVPATGRTPVEKITENAQYTGTVTWSPEVSGTFELNTQYTATITLTAKRGYTLEGVAENFFTVAGTETVSNNSDSGVVTVVFQPTKDSENAKLNTLGVSVGTQPSSLFSGMPLIFCTVHGTFAPFMNSFFELGVDMGWNVNLSPPPPPMVEPKFPDMDRMYNISNSRYVGYSTDGFGYIYNVNGFALYPFVNYAFFVPFARNKQGKRAGGWYAGAGLGVMFTNYTFEIEQLNTTIAIWDNVFVMNIVTGFNLGMFDISYTLQTDFKSLIGKLSFGYVYRFK